jgi:hypothetical protein
MRKGFLSKPSSKVSSAQPAPSPTTVVLAQSTSNPIPPTPLPKGVLFNTSPSDSGVTLHWSFHPSSATPTSPTATTCLFITSRSAAVLHSTTYFRSPSPPALSLASSPPLYEQRSTSSKGIGLFATKDVPAGSLVLQDRPLLVFDSERGPSRNQANAVFTHALSYLRRDLQAQFLGLTTCFAGSETIWGRIETNGAPIINLEGAGDAADAVTYTGVFPIFSRINHACDANVMSEFDLDSFSVGVRTTRAVKRGEELCATYVIPFQKRRERREELLVRVSASAFKDGYDRTGADRGSP